MLKSLMGLKESKNERFRRLDSLVVLGRRYSVVRELNVSELNNCVYRRYFFEICWY